MSQPPRPVYTKSRTTKRPRPGGGGGGGSSFRRPSRTPGRFHGAFTGGHSAGYYNTVGTEDGWKPSNEEDDYDDAIGSTDQMAGHDAAAELGVASVGSSIDDKQQSASTSTAGGNGSKKRPRVWDKNRSATDYMDDRDYDEWAGPTGISSDYAPAADVNGSSSRKSAVSEKDIDADGGGLGLVPSELLEPVTGLADAIGRKLLRKLGWRESVNGDTSSAYVPTHDDAGGDGKNKENTEASSNEMLLSKKRLRKIQLSERGHSLPPPKIDTYGLGHDPFKNAPEFAAHREMRRQRAEDRARAAGGGQGRYHTSDLLDDDEDGDGEDYDGGEANANRNSSRAGAASDGYKEEKNSKSNVLAYETAEDFVGKTGVGGFALHDDEDDVYDGIQAEGRSDTGIGKGQRLVGIGGEEYHRELIDHGDSDVEEHGGISRGDTAPGGRDAFEGALNAWAKGDTSVNAADSTSAAPSAPTKAVTSDGRRPLDGFVLGGSGGERDITNKRWPGPDLPPNYVPVKHVFREEDLPERVAEKSRNARREAEDSRKANVGVPVSVETQPRIVGLAAKRDADKPMAGTAFAGLAATMKDRFTSGSGELDAKREQVQFGLHAPPANGGGKGETQSGNVDTFDKTPEKEVKQITVKRSVMLWNPEPLLCKRFGVCPPRPSGSSSANTATQFPTEHSYFQKEILGAVQASRTSTARSEDRPTANDTNSNPNDADDVDAGTKDVSILPPPLGDDIGESRPPMDLFKSIFGAASSGSDDTSSSEEEVVDGASRTKAADIQSNTDGDSDEQPAQKETVNLLGKGLDSLDARKDDVAAASFGFADTDQRRRSDAVDTTSSSSSTSSYERRRRRKKKKKRRKGDDSSRRRSKESRKRKRKRRRSRSRSRERREDSGLRKERRRSKTVEDHG